ncbi:hypothetical protein BJY01DRAFT_259377 [Aspergillus pseudoustus]|uniref:C2H2-type domain-containing protein n=1 Tax=Aspergillus pseudoustus TaxID=1810923 RepID=A0ABR4J4G7_9EURO
MNLGPYIEWNGEDYRCTLCDRYFNSRTALFSRCRYTSQHDWCERCTRVFRSPAAKQAHIKAAWCHNICQVCDADLETPTERMNHIKTVHYYCQPCSRTFAQAETFQKHNVDVHHMCVHCKQSFKNENNLRMHKQKHLPRNLFCYGTDCCYAFKSFSGMLIHIESGNCMSGIDEEDLDVAVAVFCANNDYTLSCTPGYRYECMACFAPFNKPSALYQHVEGARGCYNEILVELRCELKLMCARHSEDRPPFYTGIAF